MSASKGLGRGAEDRKEREYLYVPSCKNLNIIILHVHVHVHNIHQSASRSLYRNVQAQYYFWVSIEWHIAIIVHKSIHHNDNNQGQSEGKPTVYVDNHHTSRQIRSHIPLRQQGFTASATDITCSHTTFSLSLSLFHPPSLSLSLSHSAYHPVYLFSSCKKDLETVKPGCRLFISQFPLSTDNQPPVNQLRQSTIR